MPRVTRDGVSLYYEHEQATDADEAIVFIQGLGVGRWLWHRQREALSDEYNLILPDNRGTGQSDAALPPLIPRLPRKLRMLLFIKLAGYSIGGFAADLEAVLSDAGVDDVHVVGASMGGMIAQQYALEYDRARTATLLCTTHGGEQAVPIPEETVERMYDVPEGASERETVRHRMGPSINESFAEEEPEAIEQILDWRLEQDAGEVARESQGAAGLNFDVSDRVSEITIPTLVMHGTNDQVLPDENAKLIAEKLPNGQLELFEGGSHLFFIEESEQVNERIAEFIDNN